MYSHSSFQISHCFPCGYSCQRAHLRQLKKAFCKVHYLGQEAIFRQLFPGGAKSVPESKKPGALTEEDLTEDQRAYLETVFCKSFPFVNHCLLEVCEQAIVVALLG